ncbi:protein dachsous-like [Saccostrea cucullata]|uniref:protein dachsous-like n=1 Tax=Saccostrea cuccullata TaxID=36930 RepID=UPI002ED23D70
MGAKIGALLFSILSIIEYCSANCTTLLQHNRRITINDTTGSGSVVHDYQSYLEPNETLSISSSSTDKKCLSMLEFNRTELILIGDILPPVCGPENLNCKFGCSSVQYTQSLVVIVGRISRHKLRFKESMYSSNVSEAVNIGTVVHQFSYKDAIREDCMDTKNTFYSMGAKNHFGMEHKMEDNAIIYKVVVKQKLDYDGDYKQFHLNISMADNREDISNSTVLVVNVTDVDDMDPVFDHDLYTLHIPEGNTSIQNIFFNTTPPIRATDRDTGEGKQLLYYRFGNDSNVYGCFIINNITGEIATTCPLDREDESRYTMIIKAVQRNTELRSCTSTLKIIVDDINDNVPEFEQLQFNFTVAEHSRKGTSIAQVKAVDKDEGKNAIVVYKILPPFHDTFSVDGEGIIKVQNPSMMDRESGDGTITIKVSAYDKESGKPSTSTATVFLTLLDINDMAPEFQPPKYAFPLSIGLTVGDIIGQVMAKDGDEKNTPNSAITYKLEQSLSSSMFSINNSTGVITVKKIPPLAMSIIELAALAADHGEPPLQSYAQILLSRTHVTGLSVKFTVPESEAEVQKRKIDIQEDISKILDVDVSLDKIEKVNGSKQSCYLSITAKFQNDTDVSGNVLQGLVLQHMGEILSLFSHGETAAKQVSSEDKFPPAVIALIAICGVMFIGTIILIGVIYQTTRRFDRYKQLNDHLTRKSSLYESQEMKIQMDDEQTSDYNGSINGSHDLTSLHNAKTGELKEGVVSAFTNPAYNDAEETTVKLDPAEEEAQQTLNDLANHLDAEDTNIMPVDSYNPSESDVEVEIKPDYDAPNDYINAPLKFDDNSAPGYENVTNSSKSFDVPEDYPNDRKDTDTIQDDDNKNEQNEDKDEPNPDYEVKAVRFSTQVLDTDENKFEPLKEKDTTDAKKDEESGEDIDDGEEEDDDEEDDDSRENLDQGKDDDFGDGIEIERPDEEILSPNETLPDDNEAEEDNTPRFAFDTKL